MKLALTPAEHVELKAHAEVVDPPLPTRPLSVPITEICGRTYIDLEPEIPVVLGTFWETP